MKKSRTTMNVPARTTGRGAHRLQDAIDGRRMGEARDSVLMPGTIAARASPVDYPAGKATTPQVMCPRMPVFVLRLIAPRPRFAQTLTDAEREVLTRHGAYWRPYLERGDMLAFGPVLTDDDSYGLAVVETDDEEALREFAAEDPVVTTGTASFEVGRMAGGSVRPRA